jgi:adenosylcobinamide-phosphate synthase
MAGALGVRLGGANRYDGVESAGATFGDDFRPPNADDVERALSVTLLACAMAYLVAAAVGIAIDARA